METPAFEEADEIKQTMDDDEAGNLRYRINELLQLQQLESDGGSKDNYNATSIYDAVCSDLKFTEIATIGRVKLICKEIKAEEARKVEMAAEQKRISKQSIIEFQDSLPFWPKGKSVRDTLDKGDTSIMSIAEKMQNGHKSLQMGKDPFFDFRESLLTIASHYDRGFRINLLQDEKQSSATFIVIHSIRIQDGRLPLFQVEWSHNTKTTPAVREMMKVLLNKYECVNNVRSTLEEQELWHVQLKRSMRKEFICDHHLLKRSFILCPQPADTEGSEKPSSLDSRICGHCRGRGSFSCSGCLGIQYCSRECQKLNWKLHKVVCKMKSVDDKKSIVIPVVAPFIPGDYNFYGETSFCGSGLSVHDPTAVAKNPHGNSRFIIKCQIVMAPLEISRAEEILIYDKGKILHRRLQPSEQAAHSLIHKIVYTKGYQRAKIYLHAKREGGNLRIYTVDTPDQPENW